MLKVVLAVIRPQAAVVEAEHVVLPVREAWDAGGPSVRWGAPVVSSVGRAAPNGVTRQHLGTSAVIATLLTCSIFRASTEKRKDRQDLR